MLILIQLHCSMSVTTCLFGLISTLGLFLLLIRTWAKLCYQSAVFRNSTQRKMDKFESFSARICFQVRLLYASSYTIAHERLNSPALWSKYHRHLSLYTRMAMRRFTRKTNAFSKKWLNLKAGLALHFAYYNFCRKLHRHPAGRGPLGEFYYRHGRRPGRQHFRILSMLSRGAVSNAGWITINSGGSGTGQGAVTYAVASSTGSRSGTMTIAGQTFSVKQKKP